jgi:glycine cleavage system H lipoate-binding protein
VYIDFPEQNTEFEAGESAGQMESVKTVGEIIMPLNATILEVNPEV